MEGSKATRRTWPWPSNRLSSITFVPRRLSHPYLVAEIRLGCSDRRMTPMPWVPSLLADYAGKVDASRLQPAVTADEFFAPFVSNARIHIQAQVRAEYEAAIAADRKLIRSMMEPGDELRPW